MSKIARLNSAWILRMISIICTSSSGFMPAVGSSRKSTLGSMARARAISTRRWTPYGRLITT